MKPFALVAVAAALLLTGCTPIVALQPADDAEAVECASVVVALPDIVGGRAGDLAQRETNAQGTGAYGDPSSVVVRCGVEAPAPTSTQLCIPVDGINWLRDDSKDPTLVFTTYGREPTVQVVLDNNVATPGNVLSDLTGAVSHTTAVRECTNTVEGTPAPTPTP